MSPYRIPSEPQRTPFAWWQRALCALGEHDLYYDVLADNTEHNTIVCSRCSFSNRSRPSVRQLFAALAGTKRRHMVGDEWDEVAQAFWKRVEERQARRAAEMLASIRPLDEDKR